VTGRDRYLATSLPQHVFWSRMQCLLARSSWFLIPYGHGSSPRSCGTCPSRTPSMASPLCRPPCSSWPRGASRLPQGARHRELPTGCHRSWSIWVSFFVCQALGCRERAKPSRSHSRSSSVQLQPTLAVDWASADRQYRAMVRSVCEPTRAWSGLADVDLSCHVSYASAGSGDAAEWAAAHAENVMCRSRTLTCMTTSSSL
jgi:hypothetical protein